MGKQQGVKDSSKPKPRKLTMVSHKESPRSAWATRSCSDCAAGAIGLTDAPTAGSSSVSACFMGG